MLVDVTGDIDLSGLGQFTRALDRAVEEAQGPLIVSLPAAAYFDSQGIRALFRIARRLEISRRTLVIVVPPGSPVRHLLNLVEFSSIFPLFESVAQAVAALTASRTE
jgi:anti-anti-sigma factor